MNPRQKQIKAEIKQEIFSLTTKRLKQMLCQAQFAASII